MTFGSFDRIDLRSTVLAPEAIRKVKIFVILEKGVLD